MKLIARSPARPPGEQAFYTAISLIFAFAYLTIGCGLPLWGELGLRLQSKLFGFAQLSWLGTPAAIVAVATSLGVVGIRHESLHGVLSHLLAPSERRIVRVAICGGLSILAMTYFFTLRSGTMNADGYALQEKFERDIPLRGAHLTHDEILELYVHSRFWYHTQRMWGWDVNRSYQVLSSAAGAVFVFLLLLYGPLLSPKHPGSASALCMSGGYMQLFFGDVENYTLTAAWIMAYFLASAHFLERRVSLIVPAALLAVAMMFHLLAGFLVPSLLFLGWIAWKRGQFGSLAIGILAFQGIILLTLIWFHFNGLPLRNLYYHSHAFGHGGYIARGLAQPSLAYYRDIANLMFLLVPAWILLVPLCLFRRIPLDEMNLHLITATSAMLLFVSFWRAQLGVREDWNLFANAAVPISFLVWRNVLILPGFQRRYRPHYAMGALFFIHSLAWIIANHFV